MVGRMRKSVSPDRVRAKGLAVVLKSTITPSTTHASVRLDADGSVQVLTSAIEMGQGAHTVLAQFAAQALEVDVNRINVATPDTAYTPYDQRQAPAALPVRWAARSRRPPMKSATSSLSVPPRFSASPETSCGYATGESRSSTSETSLSIQEVFHETRTGSILGEGEVLTSGGLDPETGQGLASDHWHQGSAAVELEVDLGTGKVYLQHVYAAAHAGTVINPKLARLQMHGSIVFGIGHALYEELIFEDGLLTNPNLSDYAITTMGDMPRKLEIALLEDEGESTVHGLGETVLPRSSQQSATPSQTPPVTACGGSPSHRNE